MQVHDPAKFVLLLLSLVTGTGAGAQGTKQYNSPYDVTLPPIEQRKIIGTWLTMSISGSCTRSFEEVNGKVYDVGRCSDGSGGRTGQAITRVSARKFLSPQSSSGDNFVILKNGDLELRDKRGLVDIEPRYAGLWPTMQDRAVQLRKVEVAKTVGEDAKTVGLRCYDVGYRYGHTGTNAMKGKPVNDLWDFATPVRCRNDPETQQGIQAGTRAAW